MGGEKERERKSGGVERERDDTRRKIMREGEVGR